MTSKASKTSVPTTLNLTDNSVTRDQYQTAITALVEGMCSIGYAHSWCGERHHYFRAITPEYVGGLSRDTGQWYDERVPDFTRTPDGTHNDDRDANQEFTAAGGYGKLLADARGRILFYVQRDQISLDQVNPVFVAMNVSTYPADKPDLGGERFTIYPPAIQLTVAIPATNDVTAARQWCIANVMQAILTAVNGQPFDGENYIVPNSVTSTGRPDVYQESETPIVVHDEDVIRPSYT